MADINVIPRDDGKAAPEPSRKTILIVDDQATIRNILTQIMRLQGYEVLSAIDGLDALKIVLDTPRRIDVLITDLSMPRMGGEELIEHTALLRPEMKTICLSAAFSSVSLKHAVLFLPKPFSLGTLTSMVRSALDGSSQKDAMTG